MLLKYCAFNLLRTCYVIMGKTRKHDVDKVNVHFKFT